MNKIWSRAMELVRDNFQFLVVIAGIFLLLPTLAAYLLIPDLQAVMDPAADPEVLAAQLQDKLGPLLGVGIVAMIFQFAGYGAMVALMGNARPTVGDALKAGLKVVPSTFGVLVIFILAYVLSAIVISVPVGIIVSLSGLASLAFIAAIVVLAFVVFLLARMSMSLPVLVLEGTLNPIKAVSRSFRLTGPKKWSIMLFWGVLFAAYMVVALLLTSIFGLIAALAGDSVVAMLILGLTNGLLGMGIGMIVSGLAVAMHGQLAGPSEAELTSTFE
ncbi:hypothetical protein [Erythrobacter rubeus]|uniref:Glycerophosphoryl diester phosphodiesterase membrane domain-containing protein n=1 Tax=Erythrobacter rubeus TaxID=2760803 RepID=A0ABR8KTL1_9SPHN|nr:hypothetical protein [Erythrobacter rubeus]MBD2842767.1 hypothetical protein [Erythrobacter rubeus]